MVQKAVTERTRRARAQGWEVGQNGKGHQRFVSPDGTVLVTASTPGDWRDKRNNDVKFRKAGLTATAIDPTREARVRKAKSSPGSNSMKVLEVLQDQKRPIRAPEIAAIIRLAVPIVSQTLIHLAKTNPEVVRQRHGVYIWSPAPRKSGSELEAKETTTGALVNEVVAQWKQHSAGAVEVQVPLDRRPINVVPVLLPEKLPSIFEAVTTAGDGGLVLRDDTGGIWVAHAIYPIAAESRDKPQGGSSNGDKNH